MRISKKILIILDKKMFWLYSIKSIRKFLNSDFHRWWSSYDVSRMEFKLIDINSV